MIVYDSQIIPALLAPSSESNFVWRDSAFAGLLYRVFLEAAGYQSHIHD